MGNMGTFSLMWATRLVLLKFCLEKPNSFAWLCNDLQAVSLDELSTAGCLSSSMHGEGTLVIERRDNDVRFFYFIDRNMDSALRHFDKDISELSILPYFLWKGWFYFKPRQTSNDFIHVHTSYEIEMI